MLVSIPPKYSVAQVIWYMTGKSAIHIAREFAGRSRSFVSAALPAPSGLLRSTLGRDERADSRVPGAGTSKTDGKSRLRLDENSHP